ncbi:MAG TPA: protein translocase subunit SecDF [Bacteroidales bacterium]|nr:protein translocase subunit SecDF [Bacteroidales bacterium]
MQNKGVIKFFAIIFALVCLYSLSFTFFTRNVEKKARIYANNEETKEIARKLSRGNPLLERYYLDSVSKARERFYLDSMSNEVVYNILIRKYTYKECKERELNLGLDLRGGMNVTLEVSIVDLIKSMSGHSTDPIFNKAIENAVKRQRTSQTDFINLFYEELKKIDPNAKLAAFFSTSDLKDKVSPKSTDEEVLKVIREEAENAIDRTFQILRKRIDKFGVTQPNIQKIPATGRILVELPGIKDPERVRKLLQGTAKLEFWTTYDNKEIYPYLEELNKKAYELTTYKDTTKSSADSLNKKENLIAQDTIKQDTIKEIDKKLSTEEYAKENPLFVLLAPNINQDENGKYYVGEGPVVGNAAIMDTAKINHILKFGYNKSIFPKELKLLWTVKPFDDKKSRLQLIAIKAPGDGKPPLTGEKVVDARQDFSQDGKNEITMIMNSSGATIWKNLTKNNIGKAIAIVLDDYVYSYPIVQTEIPNGRSSITGNFTLEEAKDLANILKVGKMPAPAKIVEEAVMGPSLGQEAINAGLKSFILAFILVLLYMALYYSKSGLIANIALLSNLFFLIGVMASLGAVLTLPGIAGIVLTMGMAVDANVIIYERIKEEVRTGKGMRLAIADGYKNAYSAIIDGNVTTLLTGIVLYIFGSGPVQGFATTLIIGILTSLFSAIFISRLIFIWLLDKNTSINFGNKLTLNAFTKSNINFIKLRKRFYIVSSVIILIGIVSLFTQGLKMGVDFSGGRTYVIRFDQDVNTLEIRKSILKTLGETAEVKTFGPSNQIKITTKYMIDESSEKADSLVSVKIFEALKPFFKSNIDYNTFVSSTNEQKLLGLMSSQKVGPTIADDIKRAAVLAVFFALIIIFAYIAIRFKKWQYGLGGVISLFHDSLIVISTYSLFYKILPFSLEIDQSFIAAILTIIGYSINDTVIIFDRIREFVKIHPKYDLKTNMNGAINSTLGRTINTTGTTLVTLIAMLLFGGEVIRGLVFSLTIGIIVGTYSSVFIATPIAYDLLSKKERKNKEFKK